MMIHLRIYVFADNDRLFSHISFLTIRHVHYCGAKSTQPLTTAGKVMLLLIYWKHRRQPSQGRLIKFHT